MVYFTDFDGYDDLALWEATDRNDPKPMPILYRHSAHPRVWESAVATLTNNGSTK